MVKPGSTYWMKTRRLTLALLVVWFLVTFVVSWFSSELNNFTLLGFPLGFFMSAQGSLLIYLAIIWFYNHRMRKIELEFGMADE